jgi:hypothetical protein
LETLQLQYSSNQKGSTEKIHIDAIVSSYIRNSLISIFRELNRHNGYQKLQCKKHAPIGYGFLYSKLVDFQNSLNLAKIDEYPSFSELELLDRIDKQYKIIDGMLRGFEDQSFTRAFQIRNTNNHPNNNDEKIVRKTSISDVFDVASSEDDRGIADALLFGHICEALSHPQLISRVSQHASLMSYFKVICCNYFCFKYSLSLPRLSTYPPSNTAGAQAANAHPKKPSFELHAVSTGNNAWTVITTYLLFH